MASARTVLSGLGFVAIAALGGLTGAAYGFAQVTGTASGHLVTIPVTVHPHNDRARQLASELQADTFAVREDDGEEPVISVKGPRDTPVILALLIQDDLISQVNLELDRLRAFIRSLPPGSRVMTGYLTVGNVAVTQEFTSDLSAAARSLRILRGRSAAPFNPTSASSRSCGALVNSRLADASSCSSPMASTPHVDSHRRASFARSIWSARSMKHSASASRCSRSMRRPKG